MSFSATNEAIKKSFHVRRVAFEGVKVIESARDAYLKKHGIQPESLNGLLEKGYLKELPIDPYGGTFYLDKNGQVRSTSKFAFIGKK